MDSGEAKATQTLSARGGEKDWDEKVNSTAWGLSRWADVLEISGSWQEVDGKLKSDWNGFNEGITCKLWPR